MNSYDFTTDEIDDAKSQLADLYELNKIIINAKQPVGILLGGQPASGKTKLFERINRIYQDSNFIEINGDEYRQHHPRAAEINEEYGQGAPNYTQPFSNALVEYLKAECLRLRRNFIIEGTMRSYTIIEKTAQEVKKAGFRCEAHSLAVHRQDSLLGIFLRFERDKQRTSVGRFSPIEIHDEAYRQIPINLRKAYTEWLFDRIVVYTRQPDGQLQIGVDYTNNNSESIDFVAEFERLRQPIFASSFYLGQWLALNEVAQTRGESSPVYRQQISDFVSQFKQ